MSSSQNTSSSEQNISCDWHDGAIAKFWKIVALCLVILTSLAGNTLIITVVRRTKELQTTINYFIVNMATSDLLLPLTFIPVSLVGSITGQSGLWLLASGSTAASVLCKMLRFLGSVSWIVSAQSLFWIAVDRFVAVVFPMKFHLISSKVRAVAVVSTWMLAAAGVSPFLLPDHLLKYYDNTACSQDSLFPGKSAMITFEGIYVYTMFMSLFFMTILYSAIAVTLKRRRKILAAGRTNVQGQDLRKKQALKMSFCIMSTLYLCYLPALAGNIFVMVDYTLLQSCSFVRIFLFIADFMFYLSSTVNPVICFAFVGSYRRGLKLMLLASCCAEEGNLNNDSAQKKKIILQQIRRTDTRDIAKK